MKSEVFAEDIETLLARLAGVAAARVVATDDGEIDRIFVTASSEHDPSAIRRAITSALMSEYALAVAGWRIHVARLRTDEAVSPALVLHRLRETRSGATARTAVELRTADGSTRFLGAAKGSADAPSRLRLAAAATLQAVRAMLATEDRKAEVEDITTVRLAGAVVVVITVAVIESGAAVASVGAAPVAEGGEAEAAVWAALDALGKRGPRDARTGGRGMKSRREQLEALRSDYRRMRGTSGNTDPRRPDGLADLPDVPPAAPGQTPEDTAAGLRDIRPERRGGAAEVRSDRGTPQRRSMEDEHFRVLVEQAAPVEIVCRDGYHLPRAVILEFGTYSLMVQTPAGRELIFKHAIIAVRESDHPGDQ